MILSVEVKEGSKPGNKTRHRKRERRELGYKTENGDDDAVEFGLCFFMSKKRGRKKEQNLDLRGMRELYHELPKAFVELLH